MTTLEQALTQHNLKKLHTCNCFADGYIARISHEIEEMKQDLKKMETLKPCASLQEVIDRMRAKAEKHKNFGFGSLAAMNAFLETLPSKASQETRLAIQALKPRETEESYTVFMKIGDQIYLGESAPSSRGANGEEGEGVWITATGKGKEKRIDKRWRVSTTGSAEALFQELDPEGKLNFIRASKAMLLFFKGNSLYCSHVVWEWLSDGAAPGRAWIGFAQDASPYEADVYDASVSGGVRALRDVTDECS